MILENQTQVPSLEAIVASRVRALLRRFHLSPDWIIGLVGERGSGKSLSGANIAIRDYGMSGAKLWSNMKMKLTVDVSDEVAGCYGAKGGDVTYEAETIDRNALLRLDSRFEGGHIFLDEINLEYGEARRSSSNVNLNTDTLIQQLRKFRCGLTYTVIDEMFVDVRIRENTDVFITCKDTAAYARNLNKHKPQGHEFEWIIQPMTWRLLGDEYSFKNTGKSIGPIPINMRQLWGTIDTMERQARNRSKYTEMGKDLLPIELGESPAVSKAKSQMGWLQDLVLSWKRSEMPMMVGRPLAPDIKRWLSVFGVSYDKYLQAYKVEDFTLAGTERQHTPA
jgi:hypothetical protein